MGSHSFLLRCLKLSSDKAVVRQDERRKKADARVVLLLAACEDRASLGARAGACEGRALLLRGGARGRARAVGDDESSAMG
mmetsp:Transcript_12224/g.30993  ORF Transcript_12224/g.30993 Transcript_12224/m.30993 type:complete len:81 (+) Transcript_12224:72-314(+)